jgi:serine/threonine protein phosphatase PrpC
MKIRPGVEVASLTDVGCQREQNEDSLGYWEPDDNAQFQRLGRLAIVADGMGGHEGGQVASQIAVKSLQQSYSESEVADPQQRLLEAIHNAHSAIQQRSRESIGLIGMGTTCTAAAIVENRLYYAHVGDSHLYLLRAGELRLLTRDHSLVARLIETGVIRPEDAESHPQKHVLTAALGVSDEIAPDHAVEALALEKSDVLMICSDGLWGQMTGAEMQGILSSQLPKAACDSLVKLAKDRGGPDNITLQIIRID